jgi:hypothetical protein
VLDPGAAGERRGSGGGVARGVTGDEGATR